MKRGDKWDNLLTTLFMTLAIVAIVLFFVARNQPYFLILGGTAVVLRIAQYIMRLFP
jgi:hypothetical protein